MENPYSVLETEDVEEGEQKVVEYFRFNSLVPDVKVELSDSNFPVDRYRKSSSLLVCSSIYGYFVAGSCSGKEIELFNVF
ncbi:uncharacterized protein EV154DRAFT_206332 [Mucor mucedo]|uniref:uncharacterized protein n=1 Tax=Mucor mucedo TaxID=29922 RepID=UPI002220444C|nr:uncharacterized protein EV154DRAFT_206332 [Mucor mucedo]KAI7891985.1 hypothetical protein EV154DRAFT_206332 [Mucor mucedo]